MGTKFLLYDLIECLENISADEGGPKKGERFVITSVEEQVPNLKDNSLQWIGFKLPKLMKKYTEAIRIGKAPNWDSRNFKLIERSEAAKILFGVNNE